MLTLRNINKFMSESADDSYFDSLYNNKDGLPIGIPSFLLRKNKHGFIYFL